MLPELPKILSEIPEKEIFRKREETAKIFKHFLLSPKLIVVKMLEILQSRLIPGIDLNDSGFQDNECDFSLRVSVKF